MTRTFEELYRELRTMQLSRSVKESCFDSEEFFNKNFSNDNGLCPQMKKAKDYAENWDTVKDSNCGLVLTGGVGTGKSFMAACIANALMEKGVSVRMTSCSNILSQIYKAEDKAAVIESYDKYDLLILDDFGTERLTSFAEEQIYNIINGRYVCGKPLIITTNLTYRQLKQPESLGSSRIFDRINEMCLPVAVDGPSMRKVEVRRKKKILSDIFAPSVPCDEVQKQGGKSAANGEEKAQIVEDKALGGNVSREGEDSLTGTENHGDVCENRAESAVAELGDNITSCTQVRGDYGGECLTVDRDAAPGQDKGSSRHGKTYIPRQSAKRIYTGRDFQKARNKCFDINWVRAKAFRSSA